MIRLGTRKSALALWQANKIKELLENLGLDSVLVPIESKGDQDLIQPLYAMGIQGIFTKNLDRALLNDEIDIAVHSLKDVPTLLPEGIEIGACLRRGTAKDVMVYHSEFTNWENHTQIGTGSLRRSAQWLRKYPKHRTENLRGNIQKRLEKLQKSNWGGAVFAQAGLERLGLLNEKYQVLDWMIPAPGQGIIGLANLTKNGTIGQIVKQINCEKTALCAKIERSFLNTLEGGCTAPIGAYCYIENEIVYFEGGLFSLDGAQALIEKTQRPATKASELGIEMAQQILNEGGKQLMKQIKNQLK